MGRQAVSAPLPRGGRVGLALIGASGALVVFALLEVVLRLLHVGVEPPLVRLTTPNGPRVARAPSASGESGDPAAAADRLTCAPEKVAGALRVIVVGESTVAGFPFHGQLSFARLLEWALRRGGAPASLEVVNFGRSADSSDDVREAALAALTLAPDVLVVSSGHNEFQASYVEPLREGLWPALRTALRSLACVRAGQSREWRRALPPESRPSPQPIGDAPWLSPREFERGVARYRENLAAIAAAARGAGVPLLLMTPVENLSFEPCYSHFSEPLAPGQRDSYRAAVARIEAAAATLDRADAATPPSPLASLREEVAQLLAQDASVARVQFLAARLAAAMGDDAAARAAYSRALACDGSPNRAGPRLAAVVREFAANGSARLVDPAELFVVGGGPAPGSDLFLDYCHPDLDGTARLAESLVRPLLEALGARAAGIDAAQAVAALREPVDRWLGELGLSRAALSGGLAGLGLSLLQYFESNPNQRESLFLARRAFEQAIAVDDTRIDAWLGLVATQVGLEETTKALEIADKVWRSDPEALQKLAGQLPAFPQLQRFFDRAHLRFEAGQLRQGR